MRNVTDDRCEPGESPCHGTSSVREAKQSFIAFAVDWIRGYTDGGSDANLGAVEGIGLANSLANMLRDSGRALRIIEVRQHHDEFVATETAGNVVGPDAGCDASGDTRQQSVGHRVTKLVIHDFEAIEIDKQQCQLAMPCGDIPDCQLQPLDQQQSIGQPGQSVVMGDALRGDCHAYGLVEGLHQLVVAESQSLVLVHGTEQALLGIGQGMQGIRKPIRSCAYPPALPTEPVGVRRYAGPDWLPHRHRLRRSQYRDFVCFPGSARSDVLVARDETLQFYVLKRLHNGLCASEHCPLCAVLTGLHFTYLWDGFRGSGKFGSP